jgi:hypothetical protein
VRDSQRKWRDANAGYQRQYLQKNPEAAEQNRQKQRQRDRKRRVQLLVKNNVALDLSIVLLRFGWWVQRPAILTRTT